MKLFTVKVMLVWLCVIMLTKSFKINIKKDSIDRIENNLDNKLKYSNNKNLANKVKENLQKTNKTSVFENCPFENPQEINVHIIPHSHQDPGWLKTFSEYYEGVNTQNCVKCVFNTLFEVLKNDQSKNKTFVISEISFFERWYSYLNSTDKEVFKKLVKEERVEFVGGGWVMNDEATAHYSDILFQKSMGMKFLNDEFGIDTLETTWYLDPFGQSSTNAYLNSILGFKNLVMVRIDYREKEKRINENNLEFIWKPYQEKSTNMTKNDEIFVHITSRHYAPNSTEIGADYLTSTDPNNLDEQMKLEYFNYLNTIQKFIHEESIRTNNPDYEYDSEILSLDEYKLNKNQMIIKQKVNQLYQYFIDLSKGYKSPKELLFLMGDDFTYKNSQETYNNIDAMIKEFNENICYKNRVKLFYSTPKKYFSDIKKYNLKYEIMQGSDFFPYSEYSGDYWTGYFSSRPALKGLIREASYYYSLINKFRSYFYLYNEENLLNKLPSVDKIMDTFGRLMALSQHHDTITGTSRETVANDFAYKLIEALSVVKKIIYAVFTDNRILKNKLENKFLSKFDQNKIEMLTIIDEQKLLSDISSKICRKNMIFDADCNNIVITRAEELSDSTSYITFANLNKVENETLRQIKIKIEPNVVIEKVENSIDKTSIPFKIICYKEMFDYCDTYIELHFNKNLDEIFISLVQKIVSNESKISNNYQLFIDSSVKALEIVNPLSKKASLASSFIESQTNEKLTFENDTNNTKINNEDAFGTDEIILISTSNFEIKFNKVKNTFIINSDKLQVNPLELEVFHAYYNYVKYYDSMGKNREGAYLFGTDSKTTTYTKSLVKSITVLDISQYSTLVSFNYDKSVLKILFSTENTTDLNFPKITVESVLTPFEMDFKITAKEYLLVIKSNIDNSIFFNNEQKTVFYTDSNGLKEMKRIKNHRFNFDFKVDNELESNFYPSTTYSYIKDEGLVDTNSTRMTVLLDRPEAVSSINKGELQFIISRYSMEDDRKGMAEGLYETLSNDQSGFEIRHEIIFSNNSINNPIKSAHLKQNDDMLIFYSANEQSSTDMEVVKANFNNLRNIESSLNDGQISSCYNSKLSYINEKSGSVSITAQFVNYSRLSCSEEELIDFLKVHGKFILSKSEYPNNRKTSSGKASNYLDIFEYKITKNTK